MQRVTWQQIGQQFEASQTKKKEAKATAKATAHHRKNEFVSAGQFGSDAFVQRNGIVTLSDEKDDQTTRSFVSVNRKLDA